LGFNGTFNTIQVISRLQCIDYIVNIKDLKEINSWSKVTEKRYNSSRVRLNEQPGK